MYEIHLTVNTNNVNKFKSDCLMLGYKPIIISLKDEKQHMTSSSFKGFDYITNLEKQRDKLIALDYEVIRIKVEIHPDFIYDKNFPITKYLECHIRLDYEENTINFLKELAIDNNWHPSRNLLKTEQGFQFQMLTYRTHNIDYDKFMDDINIFQSVLNNNNFYINKRELEGCILDTNEMLDNKWLSN